MRSNLYIELFIWIFQVAPLVCEVDGILNKQFNFAFQIDALVCLYHQLFINFTNMSNN